MSGGPKNLEGLSAEQKRALLAELLKQKGSREPGAFPLSFAQQRLWFLDRLAPGTAFYNQNLAMRLARSLDLKAFQSAINELVRRHASLRTRFKTVDGQPLQVVAPSLDLPVAVTDLTNLPEDEREAEVTRLAALEGAKPFDLEAAPPVRVSLLKTGSDDYVLLLTMHHIISDGWSLSVLLREIWVLHDAYREGRPSPLPDLTIQYTDFAVWQRGWLTGDVLDEQLGYWKRQLDGLPALRLPTDRLRPAAPTFKGSFQMFALTPDLTARLRALSQREGVTVFMTLLAAFKVLLHRYTGQDDIVLGVPVANRNRAELEGLVGFFVNTLVMRTSLADDPDFSRRVRARGPAVRKTGRGTAPGARPEPQSALPGDVPTVQRPADRG
jgi:hypothetical protein